MDSILKGKSVLVVEDEEINFFLIRDILANHGVSITWAEVGQEAIDLVRNGGHYDIILMDINLPGMDGLEVTRQLLTIRNDIPVVAQTAYALDSEIQKCLEAGCVDYVLKPFTMNELLNVIVKTLSAKDTIE